MAIDRSKYKATDMTALKVAVEKEDLDFSNGSTQWHEIKDGIANKFRIMPKRQEEDLFYRVRSVYWIKYIPSDDKEKKVKKRTVFDGEVHCSFGRDIIAEYVKFAQSKLKETNDTKKLELLIHWQNGLVAKKTFVCYALAISKNANGETIRKLGLLELNKTVKNELNKLSIIEDSDEAIETDPFTDPDEGRCITITYKKDENNINKKYVVQLMNKPTVLTDEELEELENSESLSEMYGNDVYRRSDFELALEGIKYFDLENEIDLFDTSEFRKICKQFVNFFDEKEATSSQKTNKKTESMQSKVAKPVEQDDDEDDDEEDDKPQKTPIKSESRKSVQKSQKIEEEEDKDENDDEEEVAPPPKTTSSKQSIQERMKQIRGEK